MFENIRLWEKFAKSENEAQFFIDEKLFSVDIAMKTLFLFLDSCYVFLKKESDGLYVSVIRKDSCKISIENLIGNISNELLNTSLIEKVTKENMKIREEIVTRALGHSLREAAIGEISQNEARPSDEIESLLRDLDDQFDTIKS